MAKITMVEVAYSPCGDPDVTYRFDGTGRPFSSREFVEGSETREHLRIIENAIEELARQ